MKEIKLEGSKDDLPKIKLIIDDKAYVLTVSTNGILSQLIDGKSVDFVHETTLSVLTKENASKIDDIKVRILNCEKNLTQKCNDLERNIVPLKGVTGRVDTLEASVRILQEQVNVKIKDLKANLEEAWRMIRKYEGFKD